MVRRLPCTAGTDPRLLSAILKKTFIFNDVSLVEHVWEWSYPLRHHLLQLCQDLPDNHNALQYTLYISFMSRMGHLDKALMAWKWQQSPLGSIDKAAYSDILRAAVIAAVASHGDAETAEEIYRSRLPMYARPTDGFSESNGMLTSLLVAYSNAGLHFNTSRS